MLRTRRVFQTQSSQNVCLFCLHRLQSRSATATLRQPQSRSIASGRILQSPESSFAPKKKTWGKFQGAAADAPSFPDPSLPQQPPQEARQPPPPTGDDTSRPPPQQHHRSPQFNGSSRDEYNGGSRGSNNSGRPSQGLRIVRHTTGRGDPSMEAKTSRFAAASLQADNKSRRPDSLANGNQQSERPTWGRHLRPRQEKPVETVSAVRDAPRFQVRKVAREEPEEERSSPVERRWQERQQNDGQYVGFGNTRREPTPWQRDSRARQDQAASNIPSYRERQSVERRDTATPVAPVLNSADPEIDTLSASYDIEYDGLDRSQKAEKSRKDFKKMRFEEDSEAMSTKTSRGRSVASTYDEGDDELDERPVRGQSRRPAVDRFDDYESERPVRKKFTQNALPSSYDATPQRRGRLSGGDRRAEKYASNPYEQEEDDPEQAARRERRAQRKLDKERAAKKAAEVQPIELPAFISVSNLATALRVRMSDFVDKLEELGFEEVANDHVLNFENASLIAQEYNYEALEDRSETEDLKARPLPEDTSDLPQRPPIVTIMGHVDHGKTTLLDFLRKSSVAASEHGGITQHIGAFSVQMASGKTVTFLDTPGHAAFLSMRQRGANVTDIVILVVAADDSVKPQTIEAIKHAKAAKVPIIVAINKIDKDEADIQGVKQDLLRHEIEVEDFGGDVQAIPVSGKTGQGLDELEEAMTALSETLDMRADREGASEGWILEATTKLSGRVATVLVRRGTLRQGDVIVAGTTWARVRTLRNEAGVEVSEAPPGTPVEVDGWRDQPNAGDEVLQAPSEQKATSVVRYRQEKLDRDQTAKDMEAINEARRLEASKRLLEKAEKEAAENAAKNTSAAEAKSSTNANSPKPRTDTAPAVATPATAPVAATTDLYFIIKADVSGSAEAIAASIALIPLHNHPITIHLLKSAVGPISESDVAHAASVPNRNGTIISFNQAVAPTMVQAAERAGVRILDENIIYKVIDDVRGLVEDKLPPVVTRRVVGEAEAAAVFEINVGGRKTMKIVGTKVRNGIVKKGGRVTVRRGGVGEEGKVVYEGVVSSLKSQKKDVPEMRKGTECGLGFENWEDFKVGDVIQCFEEKSEKRRL